MTKSLFLKAIQCPTLAWYDARNGAQSLTEGQKLRIAEGKEIGLRAHSLFPTGVLVEHLALSTATETTANLIWDTNIQVIFEAAVLTDGFAARADVLVRDGESQFRLIEVKSSLHKEDEVAEEHIDDLAYTAMVLTKAGVKLTSAAIIRISPNYRLGMSDDELFGILDRTEEVFIRAGEFESLWSKAHADTFNENRPEPTHKKICGKCDYFKSHCLGKDLTNSIYELPRLTEKKFNDLIALNILSLPHIPSTFELTAKQERVVKSAKTKTPDIQTKLLAELLDSIQWPAYYLDFETVKSALPFYPDVAPHEQILTQYSVHTCDQVGSVISHTEYLADHSSDCRRELADRLLNDLGTSGSIVVYSSFEKTQLANLAQLFPDLAPQLKSCISRLFDLEQVFSKAYYHPEFRGRTSIKVTLPVMEPALSYKDLAIGDGETAIAMFSKMVRGECSDLEIAEIRANLSKYCAQDTLAMVRLHEALSATAT